MVAQLMAECSPLLAASWEQIGSSGSLPTALNGCRCRCAARIRTRLTCLPRVALVSGLQTDR